jgi:alpha-tubulin suppressor-like RCC1 family protein
MATNHIRGLLLYLVVHVFYSIFLIQDVHAQTNVAVWGNVAKGQNIVPGNLNDAVAISVGSGFVMALKSNSTVQVWGSGTYGETQVPPNLTNVVAISAGAYHCLALKHNGTVVAWGAGTTNSGVNPHTGQSIVPDALTNVVAIAAGGGHGGHSLALLSDGTVVGWGSYLSTTFVPVVVPNWVTNIVAIACGDSHSLGLRADGLVVAWGYVLTNVPAGLSNVVAISAGEQHNLALRRDGTVFEWGGSWQPPTGLTNVVAASAGRAHGVVLRADGTLACWGDYHDGTYWRRMTVPVGIVNVKTVDAGGWTCAAVLNGQPSTVCSIDSFSFSSDGLFRVDAQSQKGFVYALESAVETTQQNWQSSSLRSGTGGALSFNDPSATNRQGFYRVRRW